ncbi:MAG: FAD-dependent oxidoreductase [Gallintestinimicrobium sp.]
MYDAIIIGAGVTGCAIARELSRYQLNILVLEKEEDVCCVNLQSKQRHHPCRTRRKARLLKSPVLM